MSSALQLALLAIALVAAFAVVVNPPVVGQVGKDKMKAQPAASAVFELYKDAGGDYRFRLKDGDGTILATAPKGYPAKADAMKVIDIIKQSAAKAKAKVEEPPADKGKGK